MVVIIILLICASIVLVAISIIEHKNYVLLREKQIEASNKIRRLLEEKESLVKLNLDLIDNHSKELNDLKEALEYKDPNQE